ncbi:MAG: preprotein translocase subunit TatB [Bordetella sp.]|nr:preprotein translocase subunit TatB [Bordetella sp.]
MIAKFLMIIAFLVLFMYVVLPRRGVANQAASRARRLFIALCAASVGALSGSLIALVGWLGANANAAPGQRSGGDALLGLSALLLVISLGCAVGAMMKRVR